MIEAQLTQEQYDLLSGYAAYSSPMTRVCSFGDRLSHLLKEQGVSFQFLDAEGFPLEEWRTVDSWGHFVPSQQKPVATIIRKNVIKIEHASPELLHFCGIQSEYDPTVSIRDLDRLSLLIKAGAVQTDEVFEKTYTKLSYNNKIESLVCANVSLRGKGKLTDYISANLTFRSTTFNAPKEKPLHFKLMDVEAVVPKNGEGTVQAADRGVLVYLMELKNGKRTGQGVIAHFYTAPPILRSIFVPGSVTTIGIQKLKEDSRGVFLTDDPVIFPSELKLNDMVWVSPPDRKVPADLWRNAYHEFQLRYDESWRNDVKEKKRLEAEKRAKAGKDGAEPNIESQLEVEAGGEDDG